MNPLTLLASKPLRWAVGGLFAVAALAIGAWHYTSLVTDRAALRIELEQSQAVTTQLRKEIKIVDMEVEAAKARTEFTQSVKKEINEIPAGSVPADIRSTLERLRHHRNAH